MSRLRKLLWVMVAMGLAQGCARSKGLRDPELRRRAASISIIEPAALKGRTYVMLDEVRAVTCTSGIYRTNYSPQALQEMLKAEAAALYADAVTHVACSEGGIRFECWTSYECRGDAIRWEATTADAGKD